MPDDDYDTIHCPSAFARETEVFFEIVRDSAELKNSGGTISLLRPNTKKLGPGDISELILVVAPTGALTWVTSKWINTYLWPELEKRIDKPSKEFVSWIFDKLNSN